MSTFTSEARVAGRRCACSGPAGPTGGQPLEPTTRAFMESRLGHDFGAVRVHAGPEAARATGALGATAYALGTDVVFAAGRYEPGTRPGRRLLAHELAHVVQQSGRPAVGAPAVAPAGGPLEREAAAAARSVLEPRAAPPALTPGASARAIQRQPAEATGEELEPLPESEPALNTFGRLQAEQPFLAHLLERALRDYRQLFQNLRPVIARHDPRGADPLATTAMVAWLNSATRLNREMNAGSHYDAPHLSAFLDAVAQALVHVGTVLAAVSGQTPAAARELVPHERARAAVAAQIERLRQSDFVRAGAAARRHEAAALAQAQKLGAALAFVRDYTRDPRRYRGAPNLQGPMVANTLVNDFKLSADEIRELYDLLRAESRELYDEALFEGYVVDTLLQRGMSGFTAYQARDEGFLSGFLRASQESLAKDPAYEREFTGLEALEAFAGFTAGVFQGIGDAIIGNVGALIEVFTPTFWRQLKTFLTEQLPRFINEPQFRYALGAELGRTHAAELRRVAAAEPLEWGRTHGQLFGQALVELVLMFMSVGWVLEAAEASPRLARVSKGLSEIAGKVARFAVVAKGLTALEAVAEVIHALVARLRQVIRRMTTITSSGRAILELVEAEEELAKAIRRVDDLEALGRKIIASGDADAARKHADELEHALADFEAKAAKWEGRPARHTLEEGLTDVAEERRRLEATAELAKPQPTVSPGHELYFDADGGPVRCSAQCDLLAKTYKAVLADDPALTAELAALKQRAAAAAKAGDSARVAQVRKQARELEAVLHNQQQAIEHFRAGELDELADWGSYAGPDLDPVRLRPQRRSGSRSKAAYDEFRKVRDEYAIALGLDAGDVHHAIERQVLDRYPGVFTQEEINAPENMRGIFGKQVKGGKQLHNSKVRDTLDRHYAKLDALIAREVKAGRLQRGSAQYKRLVRSYLEAARDEVDYLYGQWFSEFKLMNPHLFGK